MLTANNIALTANDITGVAANADTPGTTTGPFGTPVSRTPAFRTPASPTPASVLPGGPASDTDPLGDEIATLCAHINAATYRLLTLLRVYDQEERWQGCRSCAHWLSWRTGISIGPAREKVRRHLSGRPRRAPGPVAVAHRRRQLRSAGPAQPRGGERGLTRFS